MSTARNEAGRPSLTAQAASNAPVDASTTLPARDFATSLPRTVTE